MFDFPQSQPPKLEPLRKSYTENQIEAELKQLFLDLFDQMLGRQAFDANVLGAAHLGSFDLVKRFVTFDGLVLLPSDHQEASARYIYRAWKARNMQGRGLFFLKAYLQALFPGAWSVEQQMQLKAAPYPTALTDRSITGNDADKFLTSRLSIRLDAAVVSDPTPLIPVISAILPARFIPRIRSVIPSRARFGMAATANGIISARFVGEAKAPSYTTETKPVGLSATANGIVSATFVGGVVR